MIVNKTSLIARKSAFVVCLPLLAAIGCDPPDHESTREIPPQVIELSIADDLGKPQTTSETVAESHPVRLERPEVEFDHKRHVSSLAQEGCEACHLKDEKAYVFKFARKEDGGGREQLMQLYHSQCIGCHKKRVESGQETGPRVCAECHQKKPEGITQREEAVFDYSLHYRHVSATGEEKCDTCHHQYDEQAKKLVYKRGEEDACRDCHGKVKLDNTLSLKNAAHLSCVNCHLESVAKGKEKHGPTDCVGCHDRAAIARYEQVENASIPRLKRGQKDQVKIKPKGAGASSAGVLFDHLAHEKRATFCTSCHHQTPKPCVECHTQKGSKEGDWVTTENAYHLASSERTCIGCHLKKTRQKECAGCHNTPQSLTIPAQKSCVVCHRDKAALASLHEGNARVSPEKTTLAGKVRALAKLPAASDDFPEFAEISTLANEYQPSKMPHRRIALKLDESIRKSDLATAFHREAATVCAGCHHRSPAGGKPRPCSGCHSVVPDKMADKPGLKAAYHRQCMGCHESMKLEKARGCTDCHEKAEKKEVNR